MFQTEASTFTSFEYLWDLGRDGSVGIATRYGLDGPGIEFRWGENFRTHPDRPCGPPSLLYNGYRVFPGVKQPRRGDDHPLPSSAEIKERVVLYLYSLFWAFVACFKLNFIFTFHFTSEAFCSSIIDLR